jgi:mannan endo-1,4-beta-mannosidase
VIKRTGILLLLAAAWCVSADHDFVQVKGTRFQLNGQPYYFLGANLWYGAYLGAPNQAAGRVRLQAELDTLKKLGVTNLRIMAASEGLGLAGQIQPALQPQPGAYDEQLLCGLDFCLSEMAKRGMKAVLFLNNYWEWTGGMSQYLCWVTGEEYPDPANPKFGYWKLMLNSGRFYTNKSANTLFRQYVHQLILRKNSVTGQLYKDDPAIMAWQLANEPRPHPEENNREQHFDEFIHWVDETAAYIKSLDSHHLVTTGNEGLAGSLQSESCYMKAHQSKNIDYLTFHLWVLNWGWFDPLKADATYALAESKALDYVQKHIDIANRIGKPITLEEFGIPRDQHHYSIKATTHYRDRYYTALFEALYQSAANGSAMAGSNFWGWGGAGQAADEKTFTWVKGDDYTGDPPQEPQGRNSVFNADHSTIQLIRSFAQKMNQLNVSRKP